MTTTPKSVIMAVVVIVGLVIVAGLVGAVLLLMTDRPVPAELWVLVTAASTGLVGLLASPRTTPELAPGQQLVGGQTVLTGAPVVPEQNLVVPASNPPTAAPSALVTLEQQGIDPTLGHGGGGQPDQNVNAAGG